MKNIIDVEFEKIGKERKRDGGREGGKGRVREDDVMR